MKIKPVKGYVIIEARQIKKKNKEEKNLMGEKVLPPSEFFILEGNAEFKKGEEVCILGSARLAPVKDIPSTYFISVSEIVGVVK